MTDGTTTSAYAPGASTYASDISAASSAYGVPSNILAALIQTESSFNPNAVGSSGEIGLTQISPSLAASMGLSPAQLADPQTNINAGASYLASLFGQFGNWSQALQAYNAGPAAASSGSSAGAGYASGVLGLAANTGAQVNPSTVLSSNPSTAGTATATSAPTGKTVNIPGLPGWLNSLLSWAVNNLIKVGVIVLAAVLIGWSIFSLFNTGSSQHVTVDVSKAAQDASEIAA